MLVGEKTAEDEQQVTHKALILLSDRDELVHIQVQAEETEN
jgi:hypothetical protein